MFQMLRQGMIDRTNKPITIEATATVRGAQRASSSGLAAAFMIHHGLPESGQILSVIDPLGLSA
jgi:hypothetical protein